MRKGTFVKVLYHVQKTTPSVKEGLFGIVIKSDNGNPPIGIKVVGLPESKGSNGLYWFDFHELRRLNKKEERLVKQMLVEEGI